MVGVCLLACIFFRKGQAYFKDIYYISYRIRNEGGENLWN